MHHSSCILLYTSRLSNVLPYPHLNSLQALVAILYMSTSYSCDCYLHEDHTPLLPGSRGMYHRRRYSMTTLAACYYYMVTWPNICHSSIVLYISRLSNVLPYPHLNSLLGLLAILDTSISYPYNCYLHTYIPPLLGHYYMTTSAICYFYIVARPNIYIYIYVSLLYSPLPAGCLMFFPTRTLTTC